MRTPQPVGGCDPCRSMFHDLLAASSELRRAKRVLRNARDELVARYVQEGKDARAWVNRSQADYNAHHAEAHPIPAVVLPGTDNDSAPSHRKPELPKGAALAERLRAGETLEQVAADYDRSIQSVSRRLNLAGFNARTGHPRNHRDDDGLLIPAHPWDFPAWYDDALCPETDPEAFFPEQGGTTRPAKAVCAACPVRVKCLDYALQHNIAWGVWGGLSERERRQLKKAAS